MSVTNSAGQNVLQFVTGLLKKIPKGRGRFALALVLAAGATASSISLMAVSAWLLSRAAEHPPVLYLLAAAVGVRFFGIARGVLRYIERLVSHDLALRMQGSLRQIVYSKLARTTTLGGRHGDLLVRVTADVEAIMDLIVRVALPFCSASFVLIGTSVALGLFNPLFGIVLLICSIFSGIVVPWLAQRATLAADRAAVPMRGEMGNQVREIARCAADLTAYGRGEEALAKLERSDAKLTEAEGRVAWTQGVAGGFQLLATGIAVAAALLIGGQAVADGTLLARDLAVLALTPLALHESFADLAKAGQTLTRAKNSLARVLDVLEAENIGVGDRDFDSDDDREGLKLNDLAVGWPDDATLLSDINLTIEPGQKVAITGPSGLGKTTLAATVMGLIPAHEGSIEAPERISYLAQDSHIFATTLAENVKIGNRDATDEQVKIALERAGLDLSPKRIVGEEGATLSGGEAQRVALARILVAEPKASLVILDEPTEHLDHETATKLLDDLFRELSDSTLLVITHDEDMIERCEREVSLLTWAGNALRR